MFAKFMLVLLVSMLSHIFAAYTLVQDYSGDAFFDNFNFFTNDDPTNGHVQYQSLGSANETGLAGFMTGGGLDKAVFMTVDSEKVAPDGRGSVRVESQQFFNHGLFVIDIVHMPGGICGTWPAYWMVGPNWPTNGEIDIVEGVHDQTFNQMTLHSAPGPALSAANADTFKGEILTSNCDVNDPTQATNAGCGIADTSNLTFGAGFNDNAGGVYATEWTDQFIKIWFFPRGSFPSDLAAGNPQPNDAWGTPRAMFQGDFNLDDSFKDQQLVFDTTFCGDWAGNTWTSTPSCAALAPTCDEYVTNNPQAFTEAYWAINTLQVFQDNTIPNTNMRGPNQAPGKRSEATDEVPEVETVTSPYWHPTHPRLPRRRTGGSVISDQ